MSVTAAHLQNDNTSQNVDFLKNVSFSATQSKLHKIDEEPKQAALGAIATLLHQQNDEDRASPFELEQE